MLTATDLFCGAGGSSSGIEQVPGVQVRMAANHWALAVETHNANLPHADHDCADVSQVDFRRYPATDLLWASPECTNHSQAKTRSRDGGNAAQPDLFGDTLPDEAADRSRATMWDVCRAVEIALMRGKPYRAFFVENVVEAARWLYFDAWRAALTGAGYCLHFVSLNSAHAQVFGAPAPQSRDRLYVAGHLKGTPCPDFHGRLRPQAWCWPCDKAVRAYQSFKRPEVRWGRYRAQYLYRCPDCRRPVEPAVLPAAAAIDWALPGQRIGDRAKPLADKTRARIAAGLAKYGHRAPFVAVLRTHADARPIVMPFATFVAGTVGQALVVPVEGRDGKAARSAVEELRTQTARSETGLAFLVRHYTPRGRLEQMCTGLDAPLPTQTASFVPWIVELRGGHSGPRPVEDPLSTVSANGNHHLLVVPPGFVMRNNGSVGDGGEHCTPLDEELRTLTTAGHQSVVTAPLLMSYYGNGDTRPVDLPMGTATTVDRHALLVPAGGTWNEDASHAGEPMRTRTTRDTEALVDVDGLDVDDCCFRMLEPAEIKLGMAFDAGYLLLGNRREQVRLAGNAVTPPAARDIAGIVIEALTGEAVA